MPELYCKKHLIQQGLLIWHMQMQLVGTAADPRRIVQSRAGSYLADRASTSTQRRQTGKRPLRPARAHTKVEPQSIEIKYKNVLNIVYV